MKRATFGEEGGNDVAKFWVRCPSRLLVGEVNLVRVPNGRERQRVACVGRRSGTGQYVREVYADTRVLLKVPRLFRFAIWQMR